MAQSGDAQNDSSSVAAAQNRYLDATKKIISWQSTRSAVQLRLFLQGRPEAYPTLAAAYFL